MARSLVAGGPSCPMVALWNALERLEPPESVGIFFILKVQSAERQKQLVEFGCSPQEEPQALRGL